MTGLNGTHTTHGNYQILTSIGGTVGHVFYDCYDYTLLTKGGGAKFIGYWETIYEVCLDQQSCVLNGHMCEY